MEEADLRQRAHEIPAERLSRMVEACLRISESLDHHAVLQEITDSARSLTDARYGALAVFNDLGAIEDVITSGMIPEELRRLGKLPEGRGILGILTEIRGPLRLRDLTSHPRSVGFPEGHPPMKTFLGAPVRHMGDSVGNIYLTEKAGGRAFTKEDEETLMTFASSAAVVINNARRYAVEQRAKADLEALINISPVAVLVFDAKSGDLLSRNEETRRIVGNLNAPGRSLNQLLEVMALRTVDGQDIPLDELPIAKALRSGETVFAEEVVIHLPDGRAVHTLVNARPIYGEDGEAVSVVATMQDITPLEEMKSQRAEFLSRVNQELRTPLSAIKGSVATMLGSPHPLGATETRQFHWIIDEQADRMRYLINDLVDMTQIETGTLSVTLEATDLEELVEQAAEAFQREGTVGHIELDLTPDLPRIMADRQRILQVLGSFLKSAYEHFPDPSTIRMSASPEDLNVAVSVEVEVGGLIAGRFSHPFNRFSRADGEDTGTRNSRDALSLAICKGIVEAHGGRMSVEIGGPGRGARFGFTVPAVDESAYGAENGSAPRSAHSRKSGRDQARILAVDGDPEGRRYIRNTLSEAGFTPVVTGNPDEMERLIEGRGPTLS